MKQYRVTWEASVVRELIVDAPSPLLAEAAARQEGDESGNVIETYDCSDYKVEEVQ